MRNCTPIYYKRVIFWFVFKQDVTAYQTQTKIITTSWREQLSLKQANFRIPFSDLSSIFEHAMNVSNSGCCPSHKKGLSHLCEYYSLLSKWFQKKTHIHTHMPQNLHEHWISLCNLLYLTFNEITWCGLIRWLRSPPGGQITCLPACPHIPFSLLSVCGGHISPVWYDIAPASSSHYSSNCHFQTLNEPFLFGSAFLKRSNLFQSLNSCSDVPVNN